MRTWARMGVEPWKTFPFFDLRRRDLIVLFLASSLVWPAMTKSTGGPAHLTIALLSIDVSRCAASSCISMSLVVFGDLGCLSRISFNKSSSVD